MGFLASGATDRGRKRESNQDAIHLCPERNFFIVADGMGGHRGGGTASRMAVEATVRRLEQGSLDDPALLWREAVQAAHRSIQKKAQEDEDLAGMGTTLNGLLFKGSTLYLSNVGDSRCYLVNRGKLYQLSKDHSLVQEKLNYDIYSREAAYQDPQKHLLTRTVGFVGSECEVDVWAYEVSKHDVFLNCSDGLHGKVSDPDILHLVNTHLPSPGDSTQEDLDRCVRSLVDQANANGGDDNISLIMVVAV